MADMSYIHLQALTVTPSSTDGYALEVQYTREVIPQAEVDVILDHFEAALHFLAHHPHDTIGDVNLLSADESKRLLYEWNPPHPLDDSLLSPAQNVCQFIEWQVQRTPERVAVCGSHSFGCRYYIDPIFTASVRSRDLLDLSADGCIFQWSCA
jgi:non-ribosomal peptide synthetase component F